MLEYKDDCFINCHSCNTELQVGTLRGLDGFCPCCDSEINLNEPPYNYPDDEQEINKE